MDIPDAINAAIANLSFGDILLLTIQRYHSADNRVGLPIELHNGVFEAIKQATDLGIIVIESAGNGDFEFKSGIDLDRLDWKGKKVLNRLSPDFMDSGAILVGAGTYTVPHKKISYSNYGNRIDCYAWGEKVLGTNDHAVNNDTFCGTSSAAAIIAGAAISIQSICEANLGYRLSPIQMREIFRNKNYGTPTANGIDIDKIGVMPDLKKIIIEEFKCKPRL
jgi:hypothetical protein